MRDEKKTNKFEIITPQGLEGDKPKRMKFVKKTACDRCGSCCAASTPSLLKEDMPLFQTSILSFDNTFTIREGELFVVKGEDEPYRAFMELIKIRPKEGTDECIFYDEVEGCTIYDRRPSQCAAFACWQLSDAMTGLQERALQRTDLFGDIDLMIEIIKRHEERSSYDKLGDAVDRAMGGDEAAAEEVADMLQYDNFVRRYVMEKFNMPERSLDLVFGKPMTERIRDFGVKVEREGDEYMLLQVNKEEGK